MHEAKTWKLYQSQQARFHPLPLFPLTDKYCPESDNYEKIRHQNNKIRYLQQGKSKVNIIAYLFRNYVFIAKKALFYKINV
jgi:hypothetical protein